MPAGRVKVVHSVGGVCKFKLNIENSNYTGILKNGTRTGIIRMGPARDVSNGAGVKPGAAVKFLRTGRTSANIFFMHNLNPLPNKSYNFFEKDISNHINPVKAPNKLLEAGGGVGEKKVQQAQKCTSKLGLSDLARLVRIVNAY